MKKNYAAQSFYRTSKTKTNCFICKANIVVLILSAFFLLGINTEVKAQFSDIYESYAILNSNGGGNTYYDLKANTGNSDFQGANLGTFYSGNTLILNGAENKVYKCNTDDITSGNLYYRIYKTSVNPNSPIIPFQSNSLSYISGGDPAWCGGINQLWRSSGAGINVLGGLTPGTYFLEVYTNADFTYSTGSGTHYANVGGANYIATFTFSPVMVELTSQINITCFGASTGTIDITASGKAPFTYDWADIAGTSNTEDRTNLAAGTYSVVVTDATGFSTASLSVTITQPTAALTSSSTQTNVLCFGNATGAIDLTVTGGTGVYSYVWTKNGSPFAPTTQDLTGLTFGTYEVTITDANLCTATESIIITQPAAALTSTFSQTNVLCFGNSTGAIDLTVTGGTGVYSYVWTKNGSPFAPTTQDLIGLTFGTYEVTITDANACTTTQSVIITHPAAALTSTFSQTNVLCFGNATGSIDLTVTGGTSPYTYVWSNTATTQDITGLIAGTYNVTITDFNGCTTTSSATITQPAAALAATRTFVNVLCFGNATGSVDLTVTGGTLGYTYVWSNGATTQDITGLIAGTYNVTITDFNGCTTTASATITQPSAALASSTTQVNVLCFGNASGSVDLSVTGGTSPYTYVWSNAATTQDITGLIAGTYNVTITDFNGCTTTASATITQPSAALASSTTQVNVLCFGNATGSVDLSVTGGTSPYTYVWSNGATTQDITGLIAGTYNVTITDFNGCTTTASATITQPSAALASSTTQANVLCFGNATGSLDLSVTGGTSPYTYVWSNGATTQDITGLIAGTYNVTITDFNGCTTTASATITQPSAALASSTTQVNVLCFGNATGSIDLTVTGGTSPYTYVWSNTATTQDITGLIAGTYNVTITDFNGCITTASATITQPAAALASSTTQVNVLCFGNATGSVDLSVTGGTSPYTYVWSNGATTQDITGLIAGTYNVTITDFNGCSTTASATITQPSAVVITTISSNTPICFGTTLNLTSNASGGTGVITYSWTGPNSFTSNIQNPSIPGATIAASGTYNLTATDANGCSTNSTTNLIVNPLPTATAGGTQTICSNDAATVSGATSSNGTISWSENGAGSITAGATTLTPTYTAAAADAGNTVTLTMTVTSNNACAPQTATATYILIVNPVPTASISGSTIACQNSAPAPNITFTGANGVTPYTFTYTINGGSNLTVTTSSGNSVTVLTSTAITGNSVYTLVSVADANGCSQLQTGSANINVKPTPTSATISGTTAVCQNAGTPNFTFTGFGGTSPYTFTYTINGGSNLTVSTVGGNSITVAAPTGTAGTFTYSLVSIRDNNSCILPQTGSAVITVNPLPTATIAGTTAVCFGGTSPNITFTGATGTAPYTFTYKINGGANQTITTVAGNAVAVAAPTGTSGIFTYSLVSVSDGNGCSQSQVGTATITVNTLPTASVSGTIAVCQNALAPNIAFTGATGTAPYTFTYNINGGANQSITTVSGNSVTVAAPTGTVGTFNYNLISVSDNNSCTQPQSGTATITVKTNPTVDAVTNAIYCNGATGAAISFSINPVGATFSWTSSVDIGFGTIGNGNIAAFTATNTGSSAISATISVIATANSCSGIATTFTITVNPSPAVNAIANVSNCNGAPISGISFSSATAGVTYDWSSTLDVGFDISGTGDILAFIGLNLGTTPVTATVSVTASANGCTGPPSTFTITINPSPVLTSSLAPGTICSNSLFSYVPTSSLAGTSFNWSRAVVPGISNAANSSPGNINETLVNTTTNPIGVTYVYTLNSGGCSASYNMAVVVVPAPTVTVTATPSTICVGGSTTLSSSSSIVASLPATLLTQNFNGATNNWTRTNASTGGNTSDAAWTLQPNNYDTGGNEISSNDNSQFYLSDSRDQDGSTTSTTLQSPALNTVGYTSLSLNFWHYYNYDRERNEAARVQVSTNGSTWTTVATYTSDLGQDDNFANPIISLNSYINNATLYVRFYYYAEGRARYWAIDNVTITGTSPTATVSWTSVPAGFTSSVANPGSVSPTVTTVYTATYTDPNNTACPGSKSVTMTVNPKPVIPNQTTSVCTGSAFNVTPVNGGTTIVPAGTTYTWLAPAITGGMTGGSAQPVGQPSISQILTNNSTTVQTATYTVTATTGSCAASAPFTVTVSVNPKPIVNTISNVTYCNGVTAPAINFSSTTTPAGIVSYAWTSTIDVGFGLSGTGNIGAFTALNTTNAAITTTVSVTASTLAGCSGASKTFTVTVNPTPTVTITANYCAVPGKIQLTASGGGTYLWNTGQTINPILVDVAGVYSVTATVLGCSGTDYLDVSQELVVNSNFTSGNTGFTTGYTYYPDITGNNELVPDDGTNGYAVGTNGQNYHYNFWGIDHTNNATGARNFMLVNGHGSITTWQQTVNVQPNTDYYFSAWAMSLNNVGPFAQLRFEVNGVQVGTIAVLGPGPSNATQAAANNYWTRFYSTPFWNSGAVSGPITIRIVNLESALNGNDFALDDISFGTLSAVPFSISPAGNSGTLCAGQTFNLNANLTNGKAPITYSWTGPNGFTSNLANPSILNVTTANAGNYTLTVTDGYGCGAQSSTVPLVVTPLPACSISGNNNVCPGSTNTYSAPLGMTSYSWSVTAGSATISGASNGQTVAVVAPAICGTYTLSLTTVNNSCNSTCVQTFNATDITNPVIALAAATVLGCNASPVDVAAAFGTASVTDNCSTGLVATGFIAPEVVSGCTVSVTKNWTVTDICGNIGTNSQTVTFTRDTTNPVIAITAATALGCNPSMANINNAFGTATVTDNCSVGLSATSTTAAEINTSGCIYSTTRTWTVTDNCGNSGTNSQTVTYTRDTTAPVLVGVPTNTSAQCNALPVAATVTATDGCSVATVSAPVDVITLGSCLGNYSITRTWTATDLCGNSSTASQIITVIDTTPPVLLGIPANVGVQCSAIPPLPGAGVVTATDNCGTATVTGPVVVNTPGLCIGSSTIIRTWTATDQCGNSTTATQTITVIDTTPPVLANIPSNVSVLCSEIPLPPASGVVTATDNCSAATVSASVDVITPGSCSGSFIITRTWTATDQCGNSATASQIITVSDYIAPVLSGMPFNTTVQCNAIPAAPSVTATDNCDVNPVITLNQTIIPGSCPSTYTLVRTWTATDSCGNSSSESQTINVIDNTRPVITCTSSQTFCQVAGNNYAIPTLVASDNCSGALTTTYNITGATTRNGSGNDASGVFNLGVSTITWTVIDACGNAANCSVMVTINAMPTAPIVGTIIQPDCMIPTGSVVLNGLPAENWTINPVGITGNTTSVTISGLAAASYNFTVTLGTCTSTPSINVVIQAATTATWNGSGWTNGPPTIDQALVFTGNYNSTGNLEACSCTVTNGAVVFNPNHTLKITNWVHVNGGSLTFKDSASLVQINDVSNTNSGAIFYERETTEVSNMDYTYWSSPVAGFTLGGVSPLTLGDKFYSFDSGIENWKQEWASTPMLTGIGYIIRGPQTHKAPAVPSRALANFNGVPNNGTYTINGIIPDRSYLLGNPYPSALDADTFLAANQNVLDGTLYFWTHNTPIAIGTPDPGTGLWAYSGTDYASYNGVGGVATKKATSGVFGINNDNIPSGKITSGQGFFGSSKLSPIGSTILYNNTMRVGVGSITGDNSQFFKTKKPKPINAIEKHRIWLDLINVQGAFKQTLVGYITDATNGYEGRFDGESYDGNDFLDFYSILQDKNLTIQGRALPFDENDEIPLGYRVAEEGTFSVVIDQTDGILSNQAVFIEDKLTNTVFNLKNGKYTFTTAAGTFDDRFVLRYTDKTLGVDEMEANDGIVALYSTNYKTLIIRNNVKDATVNSVTLFSLSGQKIAYWDVKGREQSSIQIPIKNLPAEIYIVKIRTTQGDFSKKIIIK
jgi:hypothetical protein